MHFPDEVSTGSTAFAYKLTVTVANRRTVKVLRIYRTVKRCHALRDLCSSVSRRVLCN